MEIPNAAESGGVERSGDRAKRTASKCSELAPFLIPRGETKPGLARRTPAPSIARLANRARHGGEQRDLKIAVAAQKLERRELEGRAALEATAQTLLDAGFLSA